MSTLCSVRPVSCYLPSSTEVGEDTNLPLSVVVTPYMRASIQVDSATATLPLLKDIPKCLHCGAPHPTSASQYPLTKQLMCFLCGKLSSTRFADQDPVRKEEHMEVDCYSSSPLLEATEFTLMDSVSAMACPPLYWIVMDGTCTSRLYWTVVAKTLATLMESAPSHVHVGLLMATSTKLSVFDITSPACHVQHYDAATPTIPLRPVPVGLYKSHMLSALRAIGDMGTVLADGETHLNLTNAISCILASLEEAGHAGNSATPKYAGGKILCLLSAKESPRSFGRGGVGGACAEVGWRYTTSDHSDQDTTSENAEWNDPEMGATANGKPSADTTTEASELTPDNLESLYPHISVKTVAQLAKQCAKAAMGVDFICLAKSTTAQAGLAALHPLRSGAPGPLLMDLNDVAMLESELLSRTPWHASMAFGGMLRVRFSPGFDVDNDDTSAAAVAEQPGLLSLGVCDMDTTVCLDVKVNNRRIQRIGHIPGLGDVALKPSCQVCFAYTAVIPHNDDYITVRRMRITTLHMPLATMAETMYAGLDPEALLVVLFHNLATSAMTHGLAETHDLGIKWLQSLLECAYQSAVAYEAHAKEQAERGIAKGEGFYASERLMDRGGSLVEDDVLLGQGHERLRTIPLMIWSLLQCDALRASVGMFQPSADARCASLTQMASMSPEVLAKCVAPRLELWDSKEAIADMDLSLEEVTMHVLEHQRDEPLLLFLDSPAGIVVGDTRQLVANDLVRKEAVVGDELQRAIDAASKRYRNSPPVVVDLSSAPNAMLWKDVLVEDSLSADAKSFAAWKKDMASFVKDAILNPEY